MKVILYCFHLLVLVQHQQVFCGGTKHIIKPEKEIKKGVDNLYGVRCRSANQCTLFVTDGQCSTGSIIANDGKFKKWFQPAPPCLCDNGTLSMRMYGKDTVQILKSRNQQRRWDRQDPARLWEVSEERGST